MALLYTWGLENRNNRGMTYDGWHAVVCNSAHNTLCTSPSNLAIRCRAEPALTIFNTKHFVQITCRLESVIWIWTAGSGSRIFDFFKWVQRDVIYQTSPKFWSRICGCYGHLEVILCARSRWKVNIPKWDEWQACTSRKSRLACRSHIRNAFGECATLSINIYEHLLNCKMKAKAEGRKVLFSWFMSLLMSHLAVSPGSLGSSESSIADNYHMISLRKHFQIGANLVNRTYWLFCLLCVGGRTR